MSNRAVLAFQTLALVACQQLNAAEPTVTSNDLPRIPPVAVSNALNSFVIKKGFHLELAAAEPNLASPVALAFDENGRLFVAEMIDYSERRDESPHLGRIRMLEDLDGDGIYEKSKVFADNLPWPTAVFCSRGGVYVGATPDILFLKDSDGDGVADQREVVFTGFASGVQRVNVQAMLNSFCWGLDNRIHGATSGNGGSIRSVAHPDRAAVDLRGRDFAFDPRSLTFSSEAGGGQHGLSFDDYGHRFVCNNSDHIRVFVYDDRYSARNPSYSMPAALASIAVDGPAAEVFRISPEEPWRVIRTRWRVAGLVPGPIEGGGRSAGYFTGATGTTIYRGDAFPSDWCNSAFVGDAGGNLVHHKLIRPADASFEAIRSPDESQVEFLASRDTWFRPVQFANGPDGALYIIDMYRETIEHPWSLPDNLKKFLDLNSGNDRGRLYRVVPDGFKRRPAPRLGSATAAELVATLGHPNGWHRDTAARLIFERQSPEVPALLANYFDDSKSPKGRLHAMYALLGQNALSERQILKGLRDEDPNVREHAVKLSERLFAEGLPTPQLGKALQGLVNDPAIRVRLQLAFTLGEWRGDDSLQALAVLAQNDSGSSWMTAAIFSSLARGAGRLFQNLSSNTAFAKSPKGARFLQELARMVGAQNQADQVALVVSSISTDAKSERAFGLISSLGQGLQKAGSSLEKVGLNSSSLAEAALRLAPNRQAPEADRIQAIEFLGVTQFKMSGKTLLSLLNLEESQAIQLAALNSLGKFLEPEVGPGIMSCWAILTPRVRHDALAIMLARPDRALTLLHAVEDGGVSRSSLDTTQIAFLKTHGDSSVKELAQKVLASQVRDSRQAALEHYQPALNLKGDVAHGRKLYQERCASCHRLGKEGFALGPDLVTVRNSGREKLLVSILDPNREVRPEYTAYMLETKANDTFIGIVVNETASAVTLRQGYGKEDTIQRSAIQSLRSQGQSLMPEGLEAGLSPQDLADLLEVVEAAEAPKR